MNSLKIHQLANRSRRIPRRIRQIQSELKSHDERCNRIENDEKLSQEVRTAQIKRIRELCGPLNYQLRMLSERSNGDTIKARPTAPVAWNGIPRLTASGNFPEAKHVNRMGSAVRSFRAVRACHEQV